MSLVNRYRKIRTTNTSTVFRPSEYQDRAYESEHTTSTVEMAVRREDTRHGGKSEVVIATNRNGINNQEIISLSLREARSLKAFLDRELKMKAR